MRISLKSHTSSAGDHGRGFSFLITFLSYLPMEGESIGQSAFWSAMNLG